MLERLEGGHSFDWVPVEALADEVYKQLVSAVSEDLLQRFGGRTAFAAFGIGDENRLVVLGIEK